MKEWIRSHKHDPCLAVSTPGDVCNLTVQERTELLELMDCWANRRIYEAGPKGIDGIEIPQEFKEEANELWKKMWASKLKLRLDHKPSQSLDF